MKEKSVFLKPAIIIILGCVLALESLHGATSSGIVDDPLSDGGIQTLSPQQRVSFFEMHQRLSNEVKRELTEEELQALAEYISTENDERAANQFASAAPEPLTILTTYLFCIKGKAAFLMSGVQVGICFDRGLNRYTLIYFGTLGIQINLNVGGSLIIHRGPLGSIRRTYFSTGTGPLRILSFLNLVPRLRLFGGEVRFLSSVRDSLRPEPRSEALLVGVEYGLGFTLLDMGVFVID
jgi:hypothetical protein